LAAKAWETSYSGCVGLSTRLRRLAYRFAYLLLWAYRVVVRPELAGVKCILTEGDQVLLVRHTYGPREWDLPGGGIKRRESPRMAARREMHEELGIDIEDMQDVGQVIGSLNHTRATVYCYRAELRAPDIKMDQGEIAAIRWFPSQKLPAKLGRMTLPALRRAGFS
jgi:8-oxo-dGTP pyrophosphatase MutT (NUDIX family)